MWTSEFEQDPTLGVMEDCYNNLKAKSTFIPHNLWSTLMYLPDYKFETPQEPLPPSVDDEIRRKEEEELQRVLEMSMQDKGGRNQWSTFSPAVGASGSSSIAGQGPVSSVAISKPSAASSTTATAFTQPKYQAGYVPAHTPSPEPVISQTHHVAQQETQPQPQPSNPTTDSTDTSLVTMYAQGNIVTRVRALHTFEPTEPGELGFDKGDIIKVVDRGYKDWWRGQLKGRTGIFPVNYVVRRRTRKKSTKH